jgi:uncharacterized protein with HEPN domain
MPSERTDGPLHDILHHVHLADQFCDGYDLARFKSDIRTIYAVMRCLEIISEASRRLPDEQGPASYNSMEADGRRRQRLSSRL